MGVKHYVDSHDPTQEFPYERRYVNRTKERDFVIVYRYKTAEDRDNHLKAEAAALRGWRP